MPKFYDTTEDEFIDPDTGEKMYRVTPACWISQSEKDVQDARSKAAGALANYMILMGEKNMGPCACMGLGCKKLGCSFWWSMIMDRYHDKFVESVKGISEEE